MCYRMRIRRHKSLPVVLTGDLCHFLPSLLQSPSQYFAAAGALRPSKVSEDVQWYLLEIFSCWLPPPARLSQTQPPEGRADEGQKRTSRGLRVSVWALSLLPDLKTHWVLEPGLMHNLGFVLSFNVTCFTQKPSNFILGLQIWLYRLGHIVLFSRLHLMPKNKKSYVSWA